MMLSADRPNSLITLANEKVSIIHACRLAGVRTPEGDFTGRSIKVHCPFGYTHSDRGADRAMRIYADSNHAWCFACHAFFTPVKLTALDRRMDFADAAKLLLDDIGYRTPTMQEMWEQASTPPSDVNTAQLADALKLYCRRTIPRWRSRQYDTAVARLLSRCLALLDQVRTDEEAQLWLNTAKTVMRRELAHPFLR